MDVQSVFKLKVRGTYYSQRDNAKGNEKLSYPMQTVRLSEGNLEKAISILKHKALPILLRKLDSRFVRVREVFIEETIPETKGATLQFLPEVQRVRLMGRTDLSKFVKMKKIDLNPQVYPTIQSLRDAILLALESPEAYLRNKNKAEKNAGQVSDLFELNPELDETNEDVPTPTQTPPTPDQQLTKDKLIKKAKELGIKGVSKQWGIDKIISAINSKITESTLIETEDDETTIDPMAPIITEGPATVQTSTDIIDSL